MTDPPTRVGLFLTNQHPRGSDMGRALEEQLQLLRIARDAGWDSIFTGHHYLTDTSTQLQPVPFLSRLAAESGDLQLGIGILVLTATNPVAIAEDLASLDVICGGRLVAGVGLGYRREEFDAFAVARGERVRRFEANLDIVRRLWSGEPVTADLPWSKLDAAQISVLPVQPGGPPVWIGATADGAVRRAGRLGDGWMLNPAADGPTIARQKLLYAQAQADGGRSVGGTIAAFKEIFCAPTREEAIRTATPLLERKYRDYAAWGQAEAHPGTDSLALAFEDLRAQRFIVGSPQDCLEELQWWRDEIGVSHFLLRSHWIGAPVELAERSIRLLSEEVVPFLR